MGLIKKNDIIVSSIYNASSPNIDLNKVPHTINYPDISVTYVIPYTIKSNINGDIRLSYNARSTGASTTFYILVNGVTKSNVSIAAGGGEINLTLAIKKNDVISFNARSTKTNDVFYFTPNYIYTTLLATNIFKEVLT